MHYKTQWIHVSCTAFLRRQNARNKKLYLVHRRFNWRQRRYIQCIRYKNSEFGCFNFLTLHVQLVFVNNRERVYFEQQILTLLLVHPTTNLSCIKFAHIWRQVKGFCISWSSLKVYHRKPSMLRQNQPWFWYKYDRNYHWLQCSCSQ